MKMMPMMSDRAAELLRLLVERHIEDGTPVASRTLSEISAEKVSPATVRSVMARLEELGMVRSPHTSAGRVPTTQGYRFFVDSLMQVEPRGIQHFQNLLRRIEKQLHSDLPSQDLFMTTSRTLAELTGMVSIVTIPAKQDTTILRMVEFLPLTNNRLLVILVFDEHDVQNKIIHMDRAFEPAELRKIANYLSETFNGLKLSEIHRQIVSQTNASEAKRDALIRSAMELARKSIPEVDNQEGGCALAGETNLLENNEIVQDMQSLKDLLNAIEHNRSVLELLEKTMSAAAVQLYIGFESGHRSLENFSVVTAPYEIEGQVVGALGVIGSKRMAYDKVITVVDATARLLGSAMRP